MLSALFLGILITFGLLGGLWLGFTQLRKRPGFEKLNSREANKRMLQLTFVIYLSGFVLTIYLMLN